MNKTTFQCPVCKGLMNASRGTQSDATDGMTVFCPSRECPAQEVVGHAKDEKGAYEIVLLKFKNRE